MSNGNGAKYIAAGGLLAVGIVLGAWLLGQALLEFKGMDRYVTVKGLAEREVPADMAVWPISYSVGGDSLEAVNDSLKQARVRVMAFLNDQGLGDAEVMNGYPRIDDNLHMMRDNPNMPRYTAHGLLTVRTPDVAGVKTAMDNADGLVSRGVMLERNYEFQPTFTFTGLNDIKPDMIAEATRNARDAARQFANDSGSRVGAIRRASQGYFSLGDRDQYTPEVKRVRVVTTVDYFLED
mgnify:CR=1 FL=1